MNVVPFDMVHSFRIHRMKLQKLPVLPPFNATSLLTV